MTIQKYFLPLFPQPSSLSTEILINQETLPLSQGLVILYNTAPL